MIKRFSLLQFDPFPLSCTRNSVKHLILFIFLYFLYLRTKITNTKYKSHLPLRLLAVSTRKLKSVDFCVKINQDYANCSFKA